jgi:hypothetical protein
VVVIGAAVESSRDEYGLRMRTGIGAPLAEDGRRREAAER